jgi:beta-lactamase regulating signal transducer with metallopeptidase domain
MTASTWQLVAQVGVERVLNSIPEGLAVAVFAWFLLRIVKRQNSGTRFAVWFSALLSIAALPIVPRHAGGGTVVAATSREIVLPSSWAVAIFVVWAAVAAVAMTRLVAGLASVRRLRRQCLAIAPSKLPPTLRQTLAAPRLTRSLTICRSSAVTVPTAIGFFKPAIVIPEWVLRELSPDELKIILLHECAHLERRDDWTNLVQKIVRAIFFFHPAIWWIEKRLSLEREMACDDLVLAATANSRAYAQCLLALAEKSALRRGSAMVQAVVSHAREISLRLAQILNGNRPRATRVLKPALVVMTLFGVLALVMLPEAPTLIAFENPQPAPPLAAAGTRARQGATVTPASTPGDGRSETGLTRGTVMKTTPAHPVRAFAVKQVERPDSAAWARTAVRRSTPSPQFLLVMQTTDYTGHNSVILSFTVWRITFASPPPNTVPQAVAARSI